MTDWMDEYGFFRLEVREGKDWAFLFRILKGFFCFAEIQVKHTDNTDRMDKHGFSFEATIPPMKGRLPLLDL